jgi:hypothetical protein
LSLIKFEIDFLRKKDCEGRAVRNGLKEQRNALSRLIVVAYTRKNRSKERMIS